MTSESHRIGFGIDFGTTNSLLSFHDGRQTFSFKDSEDLPHPSVVWFHGDKVVVGREAKQNIHRYGDTPGHTFVRSIKRQLAGGPVSVLGGARSPDSVASEIFRHLKSHAESRPEIRGEVAECVVTVPVYYDGHKRSAIRNAAREVGIHIKSFVHEPFAAVIAHLSRAGRLGQPTRGGENILVFDWGGGTLDITLVSIGEHEIFELGIEGLEDRAGDRFDELIADYAKANFIKRHELDPSAFRRERAAWDKLLTEAEFRKIQLSSRDEIDLLVANFYTVGDHPLVLEEHLERTAFNSSIQPDVDAAMQKVDALMRAVNKPDIEIATVLMIGGTSQVVAIQEEMRRRFGERVVMPLDPDSMIAEGAAIISYHNWRPQLVRGISVRLSDDTHHWIYRPGTPIVSELMEKKPVFYCTDPREGVARISVYEGTNDFGELGETRGTLEVPVRAHSERDVFERVHTEFNVSPDLVLNVRGWGSMEQSVVKESVYKLCLGLRLEPTQ